MFIFIMIHSKMNMTVMMLMNLIMVIMMMLTMTTTKAMRMTLCHSVRHNTQSRLKITSFKCCCLLYPFCYINTCYVCETKCYTSVVL